MGELIQGFNTRRISNLFYQVGDIILCMNQVTALACKLKAPIEFLPEMDKTLEVFAAACDWVNQNTPPELTNKAKMQKLVYNDVRLLFGLSANLSIQALRRVCANRKTVRASKRNVRKFSPTSVSYDARIFSFRESDYTVSIKLLKNRVRFELDIGNYQRGILKGQNPKSATLVKRKNGDYYIHINLDNEVPESIDTKGVLGVDLGRTDIAYTTDKEKWSGIELDKVRNKYAIVRKVLQKKASLDTRSSRRRCRELLKRLSGKGVNRFARNKIRRAIPLIIRDRQLSFYIGEPSILEQQALFRRCGGKSVTLNWGE